MSGLLHIAHKMRMSDWAHLRAEFAWIYEGFVEKPYRDIRDHLPGQSALLMLDGQLSVKTDKAVVHAKKGQWCFPTPGPRHQRFSDDTRVLSIHFKFYWPGGQPLFNSDAAIVLDAGTFPRLEKKARALHKVVKTQLPEASSNLLWLHGDLQAHLLLQSAFLDWLCIYTNSLLEIGIVPSRLGDMDDRVLHALQILDHLSFDQALRTRYLAAEVGLSPSQLDRLFTKQFNLTPRQYFENRKLEQAIEMIQGTSLPIKQIAYELGFRSLPYFSRWFSQKTGRSPRSFQGGNRLFS